MKAKIRKTGEIVDVICYGGSPNRRSGVLDYVNYIDSQGVEHTESNHLNYYWDFESVENEKDYDWDALRNQAAIAAMQGLIMSNTPDVLDKGTPKASREYLAKTSVQIADALIKELRKEK